MTGSSNSRQLQFLLGRLRDDKEVKGELVRRAHDRLIVLTRALLDGFPRLRRWEGTDDVLQSSLIRLCRALDAAEPATVEQFLGLAALQIRRELLDLARHHFGPEGPARRHKSDPAGLGAAGSRSPAHEKADDRGCPARASALAEFHRQVDTLPDRERAVVDLLWYQEMTQSDAAAVLGVDVTTVRRRWRGRMKLRDLLTDFLPD